jgi:SAM-dependent methyltransferase
MAQEPVRPLTTDDSRYTERLLRSDTLWWKRWLDVQAPYRWNLRRLEPGFTLDIGCGIGRNLAHLRGQGVGVDHNAASIALARKRGLLAFTPDELQATEYHRPGRFDSLLLAHVLEHLREQDAVELVRGYAPLLKPGGKLILVTPQEAGYRSDPTHVEFVDLAALERLIRAVGFRPVRGYSFPFPRLVGKLFTYNEFVAVGLKP